MRQLYRFDASVALPGYEIIPSDKPGEELLTIKGGRLRFANYAYTTYEVFSEAPTLYRELATVTLTGEGVMAFANRYGSLEGHELYGSFEGRALRPSFQQEHIVSFWTAFGKWAEVFESRGYPIDGEPLNDWFREIQLMRLAIALWEGVKAKDESAFAHFMSLDDQMLFLSLPFDPGPLRYVGQVPYGAIHIKLIEWIEWVLSVNFGFDEEQDIFLYPFEIGGFTSQLPREAPLAFLATELLRILVNSYVERLSPTIALNKDGRLEIILQPLDPLTAMWFQLALAIDNQKEYKVCPSCGEWFEIGKYGSRRDKKFCSGACKQNAYDKRRTANITS